MRRFPRAELKFTQVTACRSRVVSSAGSLLMIPAALCGACKQPRAEFLRTAQLLASVFLPLAPFSVWSF